MQDRFEVGLDVGSVSVNLVVMNEQGEVLREEYRRHLGEVHRVSLALLEELEPEYPLDRCRLAAFTGMGGKVLAEILGGTFVNEVIALARGTYHFHPETRAIIDMGGEDAKLIIVDRRRGAPGHPGLCHEHHVRRRAPGLFWTSRPTAWGIPSRTSANWPSNPPPHPASPGAAVFLPRRT